MVDNVSTTAEALKLLDRLRIGGAFVDYVENLGCFSQEVANKIKDWQSHDEKVLICVQEIRKEFLADQEFYEKYLREYSEKIKNTPSTSSQSELIVDEYNGVNFSSATIQINRILGIGDNFDNPADTNIGRTQGSLKRKLESEFDDPNIPSTSSKRSNRINQSTFASDNFFHERSVENGRSPSRKETDAYHHEITTEGNLEMLVDSALLIASASDESLSETIGRLEQVVAQLREKRNTIKEVPEKCYAQRKLQMTKACLKMKEHEESLTIEKQAIKFKWKNLPYMQRCLLCEQYNNDEEYPCITFGNLKPLAKWAPLLEHQLWKDPSITNQDKKDGCRVIRDLMRKEELTLCLRHISPHGLEFAIKDTVPFQPSIVEKENVTCELLLRDVTQMESVNRVQAEKALFKFMEALTSNSTTHTRLFLEYKQTFQCVLCNEPMPNNTDIVRHSMHKKERTVDCQLCHSEFIVSSIDSLDVELNVHLQEHEIPEKSNNSELSDISTFSKKAIPRLDVVVYCNICLQKFEYSFSLPQIFREHHLKHTKSGSRNCAICGYSSSCNFNNHFCVELIENMDKKQNQKDTQEPNVNAQDLTKNSAMEVGQHIRKKIVDNLENELLTCGRCLLQKKLYQYKNKLEFFRHVHRTHGIFIFKNCSTCQLAYPINLEHQCPIVPKKRKPEKTTQQLFYFCASCGHARRMRATMDKTDDIEFFKNHAPHYVFILLIELPLGFTGNPLISVLCNFKLNTSRHSRFKNFEENELSCDLCSLSLSSRHRKTVHKLWTHMTNGVVMHFFHSQFRSTLELEYSLQVPDFVSDLANPENVDENKQTTNSEVKKIAISFNQQLAGSTSIKRMNRETQNFEGPLQLFLSKKHNAAINKEKQQVYIEKNVYQTLPSENEPMQIELVLDTPTTETMPEIILSITDRLILNGTVAINKYLDNLKNPAAEIYIISTCPILPNEQIICRFCYGSNKEDICSVDGLKFHMSFYHKLTCLIKTDILKEQFIPEQIPLPERIMNALERAENPRSSVETITIEPSTSEETLPVQVESATKQIKRMLISSEIQSSNELNTIVVRNGSRNTGVGDHEHQKDSQNPSNHSMQLRQQRINTEQILENTRNAVSDTKNTNINDEARRGSAVPDNDFMRRKPLKTGINHNETRKTKPEISNDVIDVTIATPFVQEEGVSVFEQSETFSRNIQTQRVVKRNIHDELQDTNNIANGCNILQPPNDLPTQMQIDEISAGDISNQIMSTIVNHEPRETHQESDHFFIRKVDNILLHMTAFIRMDQNVRSWDVEKAKIIESFDKLPGMQQCKLCDQFQNNEKLPSQVFLNSKKQLPSDWLFFLSDEIIKSSSKIEMTSRGLGLDNIFQQNDFSICLRHISPFQLRLDASPQIVLNCFGNIMTDNDMFARLLIDVTKMKSVNRARAERELYKLVKGFLHGETHRQLNCLLDNYRNSFTCVYCGEQMRNNMDIVRHSMHFDDQTVQCYHCHESFNFFNLESLDAELQNHWKTHKNPAKLIDTGHSGKQGKMMSGISTESESTETDENYYATVFCNICCDKFNYSTSLPKLFQQHYKDKHLTINILEAKNNEMSENSPPECVVCSDSSRDHYNKHCRVELIRRPGNQ